MNIEKSDDASVELVDNHDDQSKQLSVERTFHFAGPIPAPEILKKYEEVQPGTIKWILDASADERTHRHQLEKNTEHKHFAGIKRSQYLLTSIVLIALMVLAFAIFRGSPWPAAMAFSVVGSICAYALASNLEGNSKSSED